MRPPIAVRHSAGQYAVRFATMQEAFAALPVSACIVTDENVHSAWGSCFRGFERVLVLPPGEHTKSVAVLERIWNWLIEVGSDRQSVLAAAGGGVVGDVAGFAAATYMRGVRLIQIPTTLLSQVDSSVGGKTGIDLAGGKNLAGAFHAPEAVYVPLDALATLPERHFRNGMAEVWKYGFIMDAGLLTVLDQGPWSADSPGLEEVVARCIDCKRRIVEEDEKDGTGRRAILNFGHTVGHAIEHATGYGPVLHGEAIAIGMGVEAGIGAEIGVTTPEAVPAIKERLSSSGLPATHAIMREPQTLLDAMMRDKKAVGGVVSMSLVTRLGECKLVSGVPQEAIRAVLSRC